MAILILAPVLKVLENGIALVLRIGLEMSVYGNVSPVSNLLRQICGIENELWLKESVFSSLCQESQVQSQIEIRQAFVQKPAISRTVLLLLTECCFGNNMTDANSTYDRESHTQHALLHPWT